MGASYGRIFILIHLLFYKSVTIVQQKLILSFLDKVAPKNKLQIDIMHEAGFRAGFFVNRYHAAAEQYFIKGDFYQVLKPGLVARLFQIFFFLLQYRKQIHHLEVYPGGRFAFIYVLLAKMLALRVICVERGDLFYLRKDGYDTITRFSMRLCYRYSDLIWYREVYMKEVLYEMGYANKLFFLHNAVETKRNDTVNYLSFEDRDIDFLWVNRITPERRSDWFVSILSTKLFKNTCNVIAGFLEDTPYHADQVYIMNNCPDNLQLQSFVDNPSTLYKRARFFVFPAEFVFANNSLLEAMSYGVVPLIVNKPGFELLVEDGVTGYVSAYSEDKFKVIMEKAIALDATTFQQMSKAAKKHVDSAFSREMYKQKITQLYQLIQH